MSLSRVLSVMLALGVCWVAPGTARAQPAPQPDPTAPNVFYGATAPGRSATAPVIVFVHGLGGVASHWWQNNDMYRLAYGIGYRTAFVSLNADNTPNTAGIDENAAMLRSVLPVIADHFGVQQLYMVGHSKGGVDIQAALLDSEAAALAKAVFTISSPNQGTELADWAFAHPVLAGQLNLLNPAVDALRTANMEARRLQWDPILKALGIPFYTISGDTFQGDALTGITGGILRGLVPGLTRDQFNDGFVTVGRSRLSSDFAMDLGAVPFNHLATDSGTASMTRIAARIQELENSFEAFRRIAKNGFHSVSPDGDSDNTWAWSAKWFKGKLYIGTGRHADCLSLLTYDRFNGTQVYAAATLLEQCPDRSRLPSALGAEIWRYTPSEDSWERVFKSPDTIAVDFDGATVLTARDVGFRSMEVFVEPDGTEALYAGGVTSGSAFEAAAGEFPPPRILRSVDGATWEAIPQPPGTFLGEISNVPLDLDTRVRSFRSLQGYNGMLFASAADFVGNGVVIMSANPAAGGDAWQQVSPSRPELPVWALEVFAGRLYATTGLTSQQDPTVPGYGVYRTDATGGPPFTWTPVVTNGGYQADARFRSPNGLSMSVFQNRLYVGTNRPTEVIRINADDTWDLVMGEPRPTPAGFKAPVSGFGTGFGNWFTGHIWTMTEHEGKLYVGTWDWSSSIQDYSNLHNLSAAFGAQFGGDLFVTDDGVRWTALTRSGFGDPHNHGFRGLASSPEGLFVGSARMRGGLDVFRSVTPAGPAAPRVSAFAAAASGSDAILYWNPVPEAVRYHVYRAKLTGLGTGAPEDPSRFPLPFTIVSVARQTFFVDTAPSDPYALYYVRAEYGDGRLSPPSNTVAAPSKAAP